MRSLVAGWFTRTPKICTALKSVGSECLRCDIGRRWPVPKLQLDVLHVPVHLNIVSVCAGAINKLIRRPKCKCKHSESANFILCRPTRSVIPFTLLVQRERGRDERERPLLCTSPAGVLRHSISTLYPGKKRPGQESVIDFSQV